MFQAVPFNQHSEWMAEIMDDSAEEPSETEKKTENKVFAESLVQCSRCFHLYRQAELAEGHFSVQSSCPQCGYSGDHHNLKYVLEDMTSGTVSKMRKHEA